MHPAPYFAVFAKNSLMQVTAKNYFSLLLFEATEVSFTSTGKSTCLDLKSRFATVRSATAD
jgi:hypothetical protein